uniref:Uncharacterized protein n=1 Tax=Arundo donax TaxID=35708 RepID=A0A0A8Z233_ARUDO
MEAKPTSSGVLFLHYCVDICCIFIFPVSRSADSAWSSQSPRLPCCSVKDYGTIPRIIGKRSNQLLTKTFLYPTIGNSNRKPV